MSLQLPVNPLHAANQHHTLEVGSTLSVCFASVLCWPSMQKIYSLLFTLLHHKWVQPLSHSLDSTLSPPVGPTLINPIKKGDNHLLVTWWYLSHRCAGFFVPGQREVLTMASHPDFAPIHFNEAKKKGRRTKMDPNLVLPKSWATEWELSLLSDHLATVRPPTCTGDSPS